MPVYFYWGEDEYRLAQSVQTLRDRVLDPAWISFNYDKIEAEQPDAVVQGLNHAMTPPLGGGDRLVWLFNTSLGQRCSEALSVELERTFASLPATSHLLLTTQIKPDGRSKFTKLLQKYAHIHEFSPIAPWKTEQLVQGVQQAANQVGVKLTTAGIELLSQAVGNDTRQLFSELEKLRLFSLSREASSGNKPPVLDAEAVAALVTAQTHTCLQLADAIKQGQTAPALGLVNALIRSNEPGLRISATLIKQFRTWLWVRLMLEAGERDERAVAQAAQVSNPKRIYFLQQEVRQLSAAQLQGALPLLLALEVSLKQGRDELATLQVKVIELCQLFH